MKIHKTGHRDIYYNYVVKLKSLHQVFKYYIINSKMKKKSVILSRVPNMTIRCKHVHRLELHIFIIFSWRIHQLGWI